MPTVVRELSCKGTLLFYKNAVFPAEAEYSYFLPILDWIFLQIFLEAYDIFVFNCIYLELVICIVLTHFEHKKIMFFSKS